MDRDQGNAFGIDPLGDLEVQRALALGRARESYPAVPRETLLSYCDAAWQAALRADPGGRDLQGSFDRALLIIAWTQRRSGGRVPLRDLVEQTVPRIALEPFVSKRVLPPAAEDEPDIAATAEEPARPRRPVHRVPFSSPLPVGAALAAGFVGVAVLNETAVLPIAPLQPTGDDENTDLAERSQSSGSQERGSGRADAGSGESSSAGALAQSWPADDLADAAGEVQRPAGRGEGAGEAPDAGERSGTAAEQPSTGGAAEALRATPAAESFQAGITRASTSAETPVPAPAPRPVVRIEMPPPTMVVEVAAPTPPNWREQPVAPENPDAPRPPETPGDSEDDDGSRGGGRDRDEDEPTTPVVDVLTDDSGASEDDEEPLAGERDLLEGRDGDDTEDVDYSRPAAPPEPAPPVTDPEPEPEPEPELVEPVVVDEPTAEPPAPDDPPPAPIA